MSDEKIDIRGAPYRLSYRPPLIGPISNILLHTQDRKYTQLALGLKSSSHARLLDLDSKHLIVDIITIIKPKRRKKTSSQ